MTEDLTSSVSRRQITAAIEQHPIFFFYEYTEMFVVRPTLEITCKQKQKCEYMSAAVVNKGEQTTRLLDRWSDLVAGGNCRVFPTNCGNFCLSVVAILPAQL